MTEIARINPYLSVQVSQNLLEKLAFPLAFDGFLFNQSAHLQTQNCENKLIFYLIHTQKLITVAQMAIFIAEDKAFSPFRAPFGAVEYEIRLEAEHLYAFLAQIEDYLCQNYALKSLQITLYPACYAPNQANMLLHYWLKSGFKVLFTELNYHLLITTNPFEEQLHLSEKRKLKKAIVQGFDFQVLGIADLPQAYQMIIANRNRKQKPISLQLPELQVLFEQFPANFKLFGVLKDDLLIAASIVVVINSSILYYFMPADRDDYQRFSPSVFLLKNIYDWGVRHQFKLLDLGISTSQGVENFGLMRFKQNLGAEISLKVRLIKQWN